MEKHQPQQSISACMWSVCLLMNNKEMGRYRNSARTMPSADVGSRKRGCSETAGVEAPTADRRPLPVPPLSTSPHRSITSLTLFTAAHMPLRHCAQVGAAFSGPAAVVMLHQKRRQQEDVGSTSLSSSFRRSNCDLLD